MASIILSYHHILMIIMSSYADHHMMIILSSCDYQNVIICWWSPYITCWAQHSPGPPWPWAGLAEQQAWTLQLPRNPTRRLQFVYRQNDHTGNQKDCGNLWIIFAVFTYQKSKRFSSKSLIWRFKLMKRGAMEDNVNLLTSGIGMAGIDAAVKPIARKVRNTCKIFFIFFWS